MIVPHPMTPAEAAGHVREWLARPAVEMLEPQADHLERVRALLETLGTGGNLVTDAQIAALALAAKACLHTADADFLRVAELQWLNPLTGVSSRRPA